MSDSMLVLLAQCGSGIMKTMQHVAHTSTKVDIDSSALASSAVHDISHGRYAACHLVLKV